MIINGQELNGRIILAESTVGSHAWGHAREDSDRDVIKIILEPIDSVLDGTADYRPKEYTEIGNNGEELDIKEYEAKFLIEQLLKGNWNFYEMVLSPLAIGDELFSELQEICKQNFSKLMYKPVDGICRRSIGEIREGKIQGGDLNKRLALVERTLMSAIDVFDSGEFKFNPPTGIISNVEEAELWLEQLNDAFENTDLPAEPNAVDFRTWLFNARLAFSDL